MNAKTHKHDVSTEATRNKAPKAASTRTGRALENLAPETLRPHPRNARTHSRKQIKQIARSIERFGFTNPVLIDGANLIIAGHGRVEAALQLQMQSVPCLRVDHLSPAEIRAYMIADNKIALNAGVRKSKKYAERPRKRGLSRADPESREICGLCG